MAILTLSQKNTLAQDAIFRGRVLQGLFSKANFFAGLVTPISNVRERKRREYAPIFLKSTGGSLDINNITRFWLANYNVDQAATQNIDAIPNVPIGFDLVTFQPFDQGILSTSALDIVYDNIAGVLVGDENITI